MNILVNGLKSKTGGGKSYLTNYLTLLQAKGSSHRYFVLTPDRAQYAHYEAPHVKIIDIPSLYKKNSFFLGLYKIAMPHILRKHAIDLIFNLGDIVIPTRIPQVYFFDWPYAAYPQGAVWKMQSFSTYLVRKMKLFWFKRYLPFASVVVAQSETMKRRLENEYGLRDVRIIPNAVSLDNLGQGKPKDFHLPANRFKLLYLTYYYSHKNIEIFLPLARMIKAQGLPYTLVTTIAPHQDPGAAAFLEAVVKEKLDDVILNVGPVEMPSVPSLYRQCDAMLMPTLLETFSGTYVEAMYHGIPILTSKLDFAQDVCHNGAFYFDPMDAASILETINTAHKNGELKQQKVDAAKARLAEFPTWDQAYDKFRGLLEGEFAAQAL